MQHLVLFKCPVGKTSPQPRRSREERTSSSSDAERGWDSSRRSSYDGERSSDAGSRRRSRQAADASVSEAFKRDFVSRAEWDALKTQLDLMVQQNEQLVRLLSQKLALDAATAQQQQEQQEQQQQEPEQ